MTEAEIAKQGLREGKKIIFTSEGKTLKYVRVVAAVIRDNSGDEEKIFATARGYGEYKGGWEFPGGKIEQGESPQEALVREIREELTAQIRVDDLIETLEYDYPDFHLSMDCFWAEVVSGELVLKEAESAKWLTKKELDSVDWLPADRILVDKMKREW
ncbi:MAG: (deoxy)nucleoside triphosphate pyrophosphohydrolase [Lachnospiraceae bacterium]|nr:(deoxy)nucleoside triphosphate pyrophosphohydrolase [Lachnospiraceae bacterium]